MCQFRVIPDGSQLMSDVAARLSRRTGSDDTLEVVVVSASAVSSGTVSPEENKEALWLVVNDAGKVNRDALSGVFYKVSESTVPAVVAAAHRMSNTLDGIEKLFHTATEHRKSHDKLATV